MNMQISQSWLAQIDPIPREHHNPLKKCFHPNLHYTLICKGQIQITPDRSTLAQPLCRYRLWWLFFHWYRDLYTQDFPCSRSLQNLWGVHGWRFHAIHITTACKLNNITTAPSSGSIFPSKISPFTSVILVEQMWNK